MIDEEAFVRHPVALAVLHPANVRAMTAEQQSLNDVRLIEELLMITEAISLVCLAQLMRAVPQATLRVQDAPRVDR